MVQILSVLEFRPAYQILSRASLESLKEVLSAPFISFYLLNSFSVWCNNNGLHLCPNKCCVISFIRSAFIPFSYSLCDTVIRRVSSVKDLGVWLDEQLFFNTHVDHVINKANKSLGLIIRLASEIRDPLCLKSLLLGPTYLGIGRRCLISSRRDSDGQAGECPA